MMIKKGYRTVTIGDIELLIGGKFPKQRKKPKGVMKKTEFPLHLPKKLRELDSEFEEKIHEVADWVEEEIGEPAEKVAGHIKDAFEEHLPKLTKLQKLKLKKEFTLIFTPAIGSFLVFSWTAGQPNPLAIPIIALGGLLVGREEAKEIAKKIKRLEARQRAKQRGKLKKSVL